MNSWVVFVQGVKVDVGIQLDFVADGLMDEEPFPDPGIADSLRYDYPDRAGGEAGEVVEVKEDKVIITNKSDRWLIRLAGNADNLAPAPRGMRSKSWIVVAKA